jgi:hypothetical protein
MSNQNYVHFPEGWKEELDAMDFDETGRLLLPDETDRQETIDLMPDPTVSTCSCDLDGLVNYCCSVHGHCEECGGWKVWISLEGYYPCTCSSMKMDALRSQLETINRVPADFTNENEIQRVTGINTSELVDWLEKSHRGKKLVICHSANELELNLYNFQFADVQNIDGDDYVVLYAGTNA